MRCCKQGEGARARERLMEEAEGRKAEKQEVDPRLGEGGFWQLKAVSDREVVGKQTELGRGL
jgi:hypothetical protein